MLGTSLIAADRVMHLYYIVARLGPCYRAAYSKQNEQKRRLENKIVSNGRLRIQTFKEFLHEIGKADFILLDKNHPLQVLLYRKGKEPLFVIDIEGSGSLVYVPKSVQILLWDCPLLATLSRSIRINDIWELLSSDEDNRNNIASQLEVEMPEEIQQSRPYDRIIWLTSSFRRRAAGESSQQQLQTLL